jgi:CBS domain-containing protein
VARDFSRQGARVSGYGERTRGTTWNYNNSTIKHQRSFNNQNGQLVGSITDRDICMATYTMGRAPQEIMVSEVMAKQVVSSHVDKSIDSVERLMSDHQIRRVPIVNKENHPVGMLSLNDLTRHAASRKKNGADREVIHTIAAIGQARAQTA